MSTRRSLFLSTMTDPSANPTSSSSTLTRLGPPALPSSLLTLTTAPCPLLGFLPRRKGKSLLPIFRDLI
ncbi:hypothetical protein LINPERPRIM_LOCUS170 [Linum perenne]